MRHPEGGGQREPERLWGRWSSKGPKVSGPHVGELARARLAWLSVELGRGERKGWAETGLASGCQPLGRTLSREASEKPLRLLWEKNGAS